MANPPSVQALVFAILLLSLNHLAWTCADSVCSYVCEDTDGKISGGIFLTKKQMKHIEECSAFIKALNHSPEMLEFYEDLKTMEVVQFTEQQIQQLIVTHRSYFHTREELPSGEEVLERDCVYDPKRLKDLEKDFLEKWNSNVENNKKLKNLSKLSISQSSSSSSSSSSKKRSSSKKEIFIEKRAVKSRRKRTDTSYRPSRVYRDFIKRHDLEESRLDLPFKSKDLFQSLSDQLKPARDNPFLDDRQGNESPEEGFPESFKERFYQRYLQAILSSMAKMKARGGRRKNGLQRHRQKRGNKDDGVLLELCPTEKFWTTMVLGYNTDNELVQVTQAPEIGMKQWFLEEKCLFNTSLIQGNVECRIRYREVPAMVVNLADVYASVQEAYIKVESCAAYVIAETSDPSVNDSLTTG